MFRLYLCCCMQGPQGSESLQPPGGSGDKTLHSPNGSTALNSSLERGVAQGKRLRLEVIESRVLLPGSEFHITPNGLEGSSRRSRDGNVYVGSEEQECDLAIKGDAEVMGRKHFMLFWQQEVCYLKDLGEGAGTFIRVNGSFPLSTGCIVSFSDVHILVLLEGSTLLLKPLNGDKKGQEFPYLPDSSPILVGRTSSCTLQFPGKSLSRYHCSFVYEVPISSWKLYDGLNSCKPSTNGTWVMAKEATELATGVVFRAGSSLFKAVLL